MAASAITAFDVLTTRDGLSGLEVYAAQLVWGSKPFPGPQVESAFAMVSQQVGGLLLFQVMNFTLLIANMGTAIAAQLAAGRLLYGMGKGNALPKSFFGVIEPRHLVPRNGIILVGALALIGAATMEYYSDALGGSAYAVGAQALNFGAFIAFMASFDNVAISLLLSDARSEVLPIRLWHIIEGALQASGRAGSRQVKDVNVSFVGASAPIVTVRHLIPSTFSMSRIT